MKLAIHGGEPLRRKPFPAYRTIGDEEKEAVSAVLDSGVLSGYLGSWHERFYGGPQVQALEREWAEHFGVKHALAVNSCTSGLYCAMGAMGIEPGEEVIVSPYTMSASAVAPLVYSAIPVFADVEPDGFCLDPRSVAERITPRTRAIIVVDLFGHPYDAERLNALAEEKGLIVIEDAAQAPGAQYRGEYAGTLGHMGVFSLNYHKHIHCGEGGVVVTNDDRLAERVALIRNHAEAVVEAKGVTDLTNMIGFNFRMTEVEAAIARCQLRKLPALVESRRAHCAYLEDQLSAIPALRPAPVREGATHAYYVHPFLFNEEEAGVSRDSFVNAVKEELPVTELRETEGTNIACGYVRPLYLQPLFQERVALGSRGAPFTSPPYSGEVSYERGLCPVTERLHEREFFAHELMHSNMAREDLDDVVRAFQRVWDHREELR